MQEYIPRKLEYQTGEESNDSKTLVIEDSQLLDMALEYPVVILADSGMGKTLLIENLANSSGIQTKHLTASDLVQIHTGILKTQLNDIEILLIDAFDEIPSINDASTIINVMNKLYELGSPNFILTCRSIEWESSNNKTLQQYQYQNLRTVSLKIFTKEDAQKFLQTRELSSNDAYQLINQLDANNLSSFYENPRNLALIAKIDFTKNSIPKTKAKLFELATNQLWQEVNSKAQNTLKEIKPDKVLDCAGFIFATYLLTGKQTIYSGSTGTTPNDAINIFSLSDLMDIEVLQATIKSRLFQSTGDSLTRPWHRSIAEYLGARWLAYRMNDPMLRRRIFAYLIVDEGVIASLRGLFAWLPCFSPSLLKTVIKTDPYGFIQYSDTDYFTDKDSVLLFKSLQNLSVKNPWFRKNNFYEVKAKGLVSRALIDEYKIVLSDSEGNYHLIKTILDVLLDADFIDELAEELFSIIYSDKWYYGARFQALILLAENNLIKTSKNFKPLIDKGSTDSLRLLFEYSKRYGFDLLTNNQVVTAVMKSYSFERSNEMENGRFFPLNGSDYYFTEYPVSRITDLLNELYTKITRLDIDRFKLNSETAEYINSLIITLIIRYIEESNNHLDSTLFYKSITVFDDFRYRSLSNSDRDLFDKYFEKFPDEKLKIQQLLLNHPNANYIFYYFERSILNVLFPSSEDKKKLLNIIQNKPINKTNINKWKIILNLSRTKDGLNNEIYYLALPYAKKSQKRLAYLNKQREGISDLYEIEHLKKKEDKNQEYRQGHLETREFLSKHISQLESGDYQYCITPANVLLKDYIDIPKQYKPLEKLKYYLGTSLKDSAIKGFKSGLENYPVIAQEIVDLRILENKVYRNESVVMAGIYCRLIEGQTLNDITDEVILSASVIYELSDYSRNDLDVEIGQAIKEQIIIRNLKNELVKILLKPQFEAKIEVVKGWHWLENHNDKFINDMVTDLIVDYDYINNNHLNRLVYILAEHKALHNLESVTKSKVKDQTFSNYDESKQSIWLAIYSYFYSQDFLQIIEEFTALKSKIFDQLQWLYKAKNINIPLDISMWIVKEYSHIYPLKDDPFSNASFIKNCLVSISSNTSSKAQETLTELKQDANSSYRVFITDILYEQSNNVRDANYQAPSTDQLLNIFRDTKPSSCKDIKAIVLTLLEEIQNEVMSSEFDPYKKYYKDAYSKEPKEPHSENHCRDLLAEALERYLKPYQLTLISERDMFDDKRADLICKKDEMELPIEVKGQWHNALWTAMNTQLGGYYLNDINQGQGIYLIFYFGNTDTKKLKSHKQYMPQNAQELQYYLTDCIDEQYKNGIDVFVMDLSL